MLQKEGKYIVVFSSNYHAYYIEELLRRHGVGTLYKKAPRAIAKSCNSAIYLFHEEDLSKTLKLIEDAKVPSKGVYEIIRSEKAIAYKKVLL
ncbi:MAG: DUF3343 domain-containing protein [Thermotaleaceae bacterium]